MISPKISEAKNTLTAQRKKNSRSYCGASRDACSGMMRNASFMSVSGQWSVVHLVDGHWSFVLGHLSLVICHWIDSGGGQWLARRAALAAEHQEHEAAEGGHG